MPLHVSSICVHHQVKIVLHSLWYHHTYRCDDTRGCVMQFWPPDDELMCSKHVEAWNKLIVKQIFCASSWLITEINILRCTVSKTQKTMWLLHPLVLMSPLNPNKYDNFHIHMDYVILYWFMEEKWMMWYDISYLRYKHASVSTYNETGDCNS